MVDSQRSGYMQQMCNSLLGIPSIFELLDHMFVKICAAQNNQLEKASNVNKKKKKLLQKIICLSFHLILSTQH
jgi:hypothetical protein